MLDHIGFAALDEIAPGVENVAPVPPTPDAETHMLRSRWARSSQASPYRHRTENGTRLRERIALAVMARTWPQIRTTPEWLASHTGATKEEVHEVLAEMEREGVVALRAGGVVDICTPGLIERIAGVQR